MSKHDKRVVAWADPWSYVPIRDAGDYVGRHRKGPPRNGMRFWSDMYNTFMIMTSSGPYADLGRPW